MIDEDTRCRFTAGAGDAQIRLEFGGLVHQAVFRMHWLEAADEAIERDSDAGPRYVHGLARIDLQFPAITRQPPDEHAERDDGEAHVRDENAIARPLLLVGEQPVLAGDLLGARSEPVAPGECVDR